MTIDTRTPAEVQYDATRDGSIYLASPPAETIEDINRAQIAAWNAMDRDERLFASVIGTWSDSLPASHRAMGQAGLILLAAACNGVGPEDEGDEEEVITARVHHAAYTQGKDEGYKNGFDAGFSATLDLLRDTLEERRATQPPIQVEHDYLDSKGDLTNEPCGAPAYTNYICGDGASKVEISICHRPGECTGEPTVYMHGHDAVLLSVAEAAQPNLAALLADPRVKEARGETALLNG